jgi:hypothetical protein
VAWIHVHSAMASVTGCVDANILVERLGTTLRS